MLELFSYTFLTRALAVGLAVSVCAALLGISLVLKRYSMIGDGLSHVGFGALALGSALQLAPLTLAVPIVIAAAFWLLRLRENSRVKGDAAIAMISTVSLALGVMILSLSGGMNADVNNYLFGSILAVGGEWWLSVLVCVGVILLYLLFYPHIFAITFDEEFARASGLRVGLCQMLLSLLTAVTVVLGMRLMGAMLISGLVIFPALSAMQLTRRFATATALAAVIAFFSFAAGLFLSFWLDLPTGAAVVLCNAVVYFLARICSGWR